jgi:hypothetical protein
MRRLRTAEDIEKLEGHVRKVDPLANPLNRIIEHLVMLPFAYTVPIRLSMSWLSTNVLI